MSQNNTNANANTAEGTIDSPPLTYKQQLDEAASKVKYPKPEEKGGIVNQVVEKVSQYVPAVGSVFGKEQKKDGSPPPPPESVSEGPGAPMRPHHDTQIEEFVRDQHRSNTNDLAIGQQ